ncbi:pyridoxamine 5'-phosphate oxidase family protein [Halosegnis marinus]|uniref:Pyridoxamine 5'-phosphate oxidase family protein n=1 Tax=Halosegnis marinus TaxID=3034023 RepID=A0ABD5ZM19_9EURY|nr:pyridoxamine 5'-phosphate oxidase family protein [Halosegnis sp. DT85]
MDDHDAREGAMSDAAIDEFLLEQGTGVLALARDGEAYAVPVSFGYEAGRALFGFFTFGESSRKLAFAEATDRACLTVYDVAGPDDWTSVVLRGPLVELGVDSWADIGARISDNAWSPDLAGIGTRRLSVVGFELDIEEATGLRATPPEPR